MRGHAVVADVQYAAPAKAEAVAKAFGDDLPVEGRPTQGRIMVGQIGRGLPAGCLG
jgi:hypothetical protein